MTQVVDGLGSAHSSRGRQSGLQPLKNQGSPVGGTFSPTEKWDQAARLSRAVEETIEQKRVRIWRRKFKLYGSAGPAPLGATPPRIGPRRQAPQRPKVSALPELHADDVERLWSYVERREPGECWPWMAAKSSKGYGRFRVGRKLYSPHRLIYALHHGPIVNAQERHGSVVMHECDNPACCNPNHLSLGRQVENVADMIAKGRGGWRRSSSATTGKSEADHAV